MWNTTPTEATAMDKWFRPSEQVWEQAHQPLEEAAQHTKVFTG